ncbi:MAG: DUF89 family protein [Anaerolineae bacterium]|nr:DUF89 family protein [Anaerolineae bacterium]
MKTYLDCYPCFLRQALGASRLAGASDEQQYAILQQVLGILQGLDLTVTPPQIGNQVHQIIRDELSLADPYRSVKMKSTQEALDLYPRLQALIAEANDPLDCAFRLSIAGNIIDLAIIPEADLWATVERVLSQDYAVNDGDVLRQRLGEVSEVLFLADNAGETVFDRLLIETLDVPVTYVVKGGPVINDATLTDAQQAGLDQVARLVDNGSQAPGTILSDCSDEFRDMYNRAELIIAKGQGNYETLSEEGDRIFFLLQTKCELIARDIGVPVGSIILKRG